MATAQDIIRTGWIKTDEALAIGAQAPEMDLEDVLIESLGTCADYGAAIAALLSYHAGHGDYERRALGLVRDMLREYLEDMV